MRYGQFALLAGCGLWHVARVSALAPQPGDGSMSGRMKLATSTVVAQTQRPNFGFGPLPTAPPVLVQDEIDLRKRQTDSYWGEICGYVNGDARSPFGCDPSSTCRTDTKYSVIQCCHATPNAGVSCPAMTACLDQTAYSSVLQTATTTDPIGIATGWCTASLYEYCVQMIFSEVPVQGFTWIQCGGQPTRQVAILSATTNLPSASTTPDTSTFSPTTSPPTSGPTSPPAPSTTPVGAIVGGVVGGIAVIGLVVLGLFYINRRKRNHETPPPAPQPEVGYAPGPDPPPIGYGPPADYRGSTFKAPYETISTVSPTSPSFPQPSGDGTGTGITQYHTPPPAENMTHHQAPPSNAGTGVTLAQAQPQAQYPPVQHPQSGHGHVVPGTQQQPPVYPDQRYELPIEGGDGDLRELRG